MNVYDEEEVLKNRWGRDIEGMKHITERKKALEESIQKKIDAFVAENGISKYIVEVVQADSAHAKVTVKVIF